MGKVCYIEKKFSKANAELIELMNALIRSYQAEGYVLTVRQLYYQLVARDIISNTLQEYKRVAGIINDAKLAGLIDWDAIEDRTREFVVQPHWNTGAEIVRAVANQYNQDRWVNQAARVFVIIEKEALVGVLAKTCKKWDVPILAARGYPSGTVLREFAEQHLLPAQRGGQGAVILHLGDHDPSGIDMTRDLRDRLELFTWGQVDDIFRIGLTMDQIEEVNPPENPAKATDSRFESYREQFGESSWELDALSPSYLNELVEEHITDQIDSEEWDAIQEQVDEVKARLDDVATQFEEDSE